VANETFVWGFMNESAATLETLGWDCSTTSSSRIEQSNAHQYKPAGAPSNYSLRFDDGEYARAPSVGQPATAAGSVTTATRLNTGTTPSDDPIILVTDGSASTYVRANTDSTKPRLYQSNQKAQAR
jgi:hypothetical protein